ncbi:MAG: endonuclease/exonuclease/phosphatase family protein [Deltaproteobacteria bacterium]|nr:endonuclease/exonuclease/phosphatase family protein [Deltaproteobacteria bacterium]
MPTIKVASWNIEWMNFWFTPDSAPAALRTTFVQDQVVNDTNTTATRAVNVITAIDPDILAIQEAPSRLEELKLFVDTYLHGQGPAKYKYFLSDSGGAQKVAVIYQHAKFAAVALESSANIAPLISAWEADVDGDGYLEPYEFTRRPLVVNFDVSGTNLQLVVLHTKSSYVNQGEALWNDPARRQEYVVAALKARRRNAAECMRTRAYVDRVLANDSQAKLIVCGDLNDGPGQDYFEEKYLSHNLTDILVGSGFEPEGLFEHAMRDVPAAQRYTAVFDDFVPVKTPNRQLLLDHLLLSPGLTAAAGLRRRAGSGTICHTEHNAEVPPGGSAKREDRPSDHRPVAVLLEY